LPHILPPVSRRLALAAMSLAVVGSASAQSTANDDTAALAAIVQRYAQALRANDAATLVSLYTADGVFMREYFPPAVGRDALQAAYRAVFEALKLELEFQIQESQVTGDMAWLRLHSQGKQKTLATGVELQTAFNGLVVFRREAGAWKIRCYIYTSSKADGGR
jgi:uncharacterized protein (TIGR02246 family)